MPPPPPSMMNRDSQPMDMGLGSSLGMISISDLTDNQFPFDDINSAANEDLPEDDIPGPPLDPEDYRLASSPSLDELMTPMHDGEDDPILMAKVSITFITIISVLPCVKSSKD